MDEEEEEEEEEDEDMTHDCVDLSVLCPPCPHSAFVPLTPRRCRRSVYSFKKTFAHIAFTTTASALTGLLSNWTAHRSLKKTSSSVWNAGSCYSWTVMCALAIFQWRCLHFSCNAHTPGGYALHKERFQSKKKNKKRVKIVRVRVRTCRESICGWRACLSQCFKKRKVHEMHETGAHSQDPNGFQTIQRLSSMSLRNSP